MTYSPFKRHTSSFSWPLGFLRCLSSSKQRTSYLVIVPTYLSVVEEYTTAFRSPQVAIDCNIASSSELSGLAGDGTRGAASIANTLVRHSLMRSNQAIVVITATTTNPNNLTWHPRCVGGRRCVSWRRSDARWRGLPCCIGCTKSAHGGTSLNDALKPSYCCHYSHNNKP